MTTDELVAHVVNFATLLRDGGVDCSFTYVHEKDNKVTVRITCERQPAEGDDRLFEPLSQKVDEPFSPLT